MVVKVQVTAQVRWGRGGQEADTHFEREEVSIWNPFSEKRNIDKR